MRVGRNIYRLIRTVIFSVILALIALYLLAYAAISLPFVRNKVRQIVQTELSDYLGGEIRIGGLQLMPFNEAVLTDVSVIDPGGETVATIGRLGAGINIWRLIAKQEIEITYAEILGLDAHLWQQEKGGQLNIQYIIDAVSPKDKTKPPTLFDFNIRQVVIRKSALTFDKRWIPASDTPGKIDFNHLSVSNLRADISLPRIKNDDFTVDLRRLSLAEKSGLTIDKLSLRAHITDTELTLNDIELELPQTSIRLNNQHFEYDGYADLGKRLAEGRHHIVLSGARVTPADLSCFLPELKTFTQPLFITADVKGNLAGIDVQELSISSLDERMMLSLRGSLMNLTDKHRLAVTLPRITLHTSEPEIARIAAMLGGKIPAHVSDILSRIGSVTLDAQASATMDRADFDGIINTALGRVEATLKADYAGRRLNHIAGRVTADDVQLGVLTGQSMLGNLTAYADGDVAIAGKDVSGKADIDIKRFGFDGYEWTGLTARIAGDMNAVKASLNLSDPLARLTADGSVSGLKTKNYAIDLTADIENLDLAAIKVKHPDLAGAVVRGNIVARLFGSNIDDAQGSADVQNLSLHAFRGRNIDLNHLFFEANGPISDRHLSLQCDWLDVWADGNFRTAELPTAVSRMLSAAMPSMFRRPAGTVREETDCNIRLHLPKNSPLLSYVSLPVTLLTDLDVTANISADHASVDLDLPYLQQGKDKLIQNTRLHADLDLPTETGRVDLTTLWPGKKEDIPLYLNAVAADDRLSANAGWDFRRDKAYRGDVSFTLTPIINDLNLTEGWNLQLNPTDFWVNDATWNVAAGDVQWIDRRASISGVKVSHDNQFVTVNGHLSASPNDTVRAELADIDLGYIFDTLNINYVTFGGSATGSAIAGGVLGKQMFAVTDGLWVKDFSYNNAPLGDKAELRGLWDNNNQRVGIYADISERGRRRAIVDGNVWVKRDSLAFIFDTDSINVKFLQPFMQAFTSDFGGRASGRAHLYGTFSDIDLEGRVHADSVSLLVDYTKVRYHGADSVDLRPGHITIPSFRLYDKEGNSGILTGDLRHRFFHDPVFTFRITDADNLLCYDTDSKDNPIWFGHIYGNGGGSVNGRPGYVGISVDMDIAPRSIFNFVLSDEEAAAEYTFLTFSDRRKEMQEMQVEVVDTTPDFVKAFRRKVNKQNEADVPSVFALDVRTSVTPDGEMVLVMDPVAGDKIRAFGNGALQLGYNSASDEFNMYGKYTLDRGTYNFSLQDIILKDFTIRPGSSIAFNGDPLRAQLDIDAAYRVNTSLTDLDKSFASDRDLNRTNVPVDAVLQVRGDMSHPDINFDIELPTLADDAVRKVKSIISTEDMLSRQIIYLLALNRFYTPEYMGGQSTGGEWASVASATLASQLTNALSSLSDKFTLAPSLRTEKGDFSDMEVDVALSSRLLNNRLLLNGNFGYRDKATSNTTFVGDFDLEYLLSPSGTWRLKAYNHFNDQNYYLRSALTTQGIGVMYRRDFDRLFNWKKRRPKNR